MPRRRSESKHPSGAVHASQHTVAPKGPRFQFVTLDPGLRLDRRVDVERRARVDAILATIPEPERRDAYLATVRRKPARTSAG